MRSKLGLLLALAFSLAWLAHARVPIEVKGDRITYKEGGRWVEAQGHVVITYENVRMNCDYAEVDLKENIARAKGHVVIVEARGVLHGDYAEYDFNKEKGKILKADFSSGPYYGSAEELRKEGPEKYSADSCYITTCDPARPHPLNYRLVAKSVEIYPGEKVVAREVRFKVGRYTLFYFPKYVHRLDDRRPNIKVVPGHDEEWGTFVLTTLKQTLTDSLDAKFNLDWREKRGIGFGPDLFYHTGFGSGVLRTYYIHEKDEELLEDLGGLRKRDRYKVQLIHQWDIDEDQRLVLEYHKFSDKYVLKDFYYNEEYEYDPTPISYLLYTRDDALGTFSLYLEKRVNHFYTETEYLPELKYTLYSHKLWDNVYLSGNLQADNLSRRFSDGSSALSAWRVDGYLQLLYTASLGHIDISPYVGIRQTYYSRDVDGQETLWRGVGYFGLDVSTRLYKVFSDDFRHVVRPWIRYRYNPWPTVRAERLQQFDWLDAIERTNDLSFGMENIIQVKQEDGSVRDLLKFDWSAMYHIKPERGSWFDYLDLEGSFMPSDRWRIDAEYRYGLDEGDWRYGSVDLWFRPFDVLEVGVGHQYRNGDMAQTVAECKWQVAEGWRLETYHRYEFEEGAMQEQTYAVIKDLGCWELEVAYSDEKYGSSTFWVIMRIKAFPDVGVKLRSSYRRRTD